MKAKAISVKEYLESLPDDRKKIISEILKVIKKNIPKGFKEEMSYGMPGYIVPHSLYSKGYHCNPKLPLPFICIASQKNFISLHHLGLYSDNKILSWFESEYSKQCKTKLDMGKGCIRFKKMDDIPFKLIGELSSKMTTEDWIKIYEKKYISKI